MIGVHALIVIFDCANVNRSVLASISLFVSLCVSVFPLKSELDGFHDRTRSVDHGVDTCCDLASWRSTVTFESRIKNPVTLRSVYISPLPDFFLGRGADLHWMPYTSDSEDPPKVMS